MYFNKPIQRYWYEAHVEYVYNLYTFVYSSMFKHLLSIAVETSLESRFVGTAALQLRGITVHRKAVAAMGMKPSHESVREQGSLTCRDRPS